LVGYWAVGGWHQRCGASTLQGTGLITVVPDPRLNALIVEANEVDLQFVEQLAARHRPREQHHGHRNHRGPAVDPGDLQFGRGDRRGGPASLRGSDCYQRGQQRQPSPEDLIRALRGQRGGGGQDSRGEIQKMTVGVDARSNSLIITAPEPLFRQVETLVQQIDQPGSPDTDFVLIQPIKVSDPEVVKKALGSLMTTPTTSRPSTQQSTAPRPTTGGEDQRAEFFRRLREAGAFGGGSSRGLRRRSSRRA
jgi:hypothetical protein